MATKVEKVTAHLKRNWKVYTVSAIGVAAITCLIMKERKTMIPRVVAPEIPRVTGEHSNAQARSFSFALFMRDSGNATATIHTGEKGHPGFITRCLETGELFTSQYSAAKTYDASPSVMSGHLNGKLDDVYGKHFERVFLN